MSWVQVIQVESKVLIKDKQDLNIEMLGSEKNRIQEEKSRIHIRDE